MRRAPKPLALALQSYGPMVLKRVLQFLLFLLLAGCGHETYSTSLVGNGSGYDKDGHQPTPKSEPLPSTGSESQDPDGNAGVSDQLTPSPITSPDPDPEPTPDPELSPESSM